MAVSPQTPGPLPERVYWFRRAIVLAGLFALVFGVTRVLVPQDDAAQEPGAATVAATAAETPAAAAEPAVKAAAGGESKDEAAEPQAPAEPSTTPEPVAKPEPSGVCDPSDLVVTPVVPAERPKLRIPIALTINSTSVEACTFDASADSLAVKIDSGPRDTPDLVWQLAHCPLAIEGGRVTVYKEHDTNVSFTWSGRRSDSSCSDDTEWSQRGWYHVTAATYGGEPTSVQFELTRLTGVTVTRTVDPEPEPRRKQRDGAVEPDRLPSDS